MIVRIIFSIGQLYLTKEDPLILLVNQNLKKRTGTLEVCPLNQHILEHVLLLVKIDANWGTPHWPVELRIETGIP